MPSTSSVPPISFTSTGVQLPTDSDILAGAFADLDAAFGGGLNMTSLTSPGGQLATSLTAIVSDKNAEVATVVTQIDPQYSDGVWQDALAKLYFLTRKEATATVVTCTVGGLAGTTIPAGQALAQDGNGETYYNASAITIGAAGTASATFINQSTGPIACAANTLTRVYRAYPGWETITNPAPGVLGRDLENRIDFEARRRNSVAANGVGSAEAVYGAVAALDGVSDLYVYDNKTGAPVAAGETSYSVPAHTIVASVVGGADADIADAIWRKNGSGGTAGNVSVSIVDTETGYSPPYPEYSVSFLRPASTLVHFKVTVAANPLLPADIVSIIQSAILARFTGADGGARARIGAAIYGSNYYAPVVAIDSSVSVLSIQVGLAADPTGFSVVMGIDQAPVVSAASIQVVVSA